MSALPAPQAFRTLLTSPLCPMIPALLLVIMGITTASAQTLITVPNFSFESSLSGNWTTVSAGGGSVVSQTANGPYPLTNSTLNSPAQGNDFLAMFNAVGNGTTQTASITLATTFSINTTYTLTVAVGHPASNPFSGAEIQLFAGSTLIASDSVTSLSSSDQFFTMTANSTLGTGTAGQSLKIVLTDLGQGVDYRTDFDNVVLTATAVPEPRKAMLLGVAGALCFLDKRTWVLFKGNRLLALSAIFK